MSGEADRGRGIVLVIIGVTLGTSALVIITTNLKIGPQRLPQQVVRFVLTVLLTVCLYRGVGWARWLSVILFGLAGVGALGVGLLADTGARLVLLVMGVCYVVCGGVLLLSKAVAAFFAQQQGSG